MPYVVEHYIACDACGLRMRAKSNERPEGWIVARTDQGRKTYCSSMCQHSPSNIRRSIYALTPIEVQMLRFIACGLQNKEIARRLKRSLYTVKNHLTVVYNKLGVTGREAAVTLAIARGLIDIESKMVVRLIEDARYRRDRWRVCNYCLRGGHRQCRGCSCRSGYCGKF